MEETDGGSVDVLKLVEEGVAAVALAIKNSVVTASDVMKAVVENIETIENDDERALNAFIHFNLSKSLALKRAEDIDTMTVDEKVRLPLGITYNPNV